MEKIKLSSEMIENKAFNADFKGYSPIEVDSYLDLVIEDYEAFESEIEILTRQLKHYEQLIHDLSQENSLLKGKLTSSDQSGVNNSTIDLIRRVARLEEVVFNQNK